MKKQWVRTTGGIISILMIIITVIGAGVVLWYTVFRPSNAFTSSNTSSFKRVNELLVNKTTATGQKPFDSDTVETMVNMIYGSAGNIYDQMNSMSATTTPRTAATLRAKTYNKTNGQSIVVRLGGLDWIVTFVSKDRYGDLVATLWLSNNYQSEWGTTSNNLGEHYGLVNGGLYSDWSADWYHRYAGTYPSSMYGTSYIRTATLNNPYSKRYSTDNDTIEQYTYSGSSDHIFALYTVASKGLTYYLKTPYNMSWMNALQNPANRNQSTYWLTNEALTSTNSSNYTGSWVSSSQDFYSANSTYYTSWGEDYLWLPSMAEVGYCDDYDGLWEMSTAERSTYNGSTSSISTSYIGTSQTNDSGTAYCRTWTRSASCSQSSYSMSVYALPAAGNTEGSGSVCSSLAVRPCLLLSLTDVMAHHDGTVLTFDKQSGSGGTDKMLANSGDTLYNISTPTRTGYDFAGYYTSTNGGGTQVYTASGTPVSSTSAFSSNTTIYAKWIPHTYTVSYNSNGGSGSMSSTSHTYGVSKNLSTCSFTRTGYTFSGWATSSSGSKQYNDGASVSNLTAVDGGTVRLYAGWTANTYYVRYNSNGGSGSMSNSTHTYNSYKSLTSNAFSRTGYTFSGWATSSTGSMSYTDGASVRNLTSTNGATVDLYAVWTAVSVTITLDNQSATNAGTTSVTATYDVSLLSITPPTRRGYSFRGYFTQTNGGGQKIYDIDGDPNITVSKYTANLTLYAYWIACASVTMTGATTQFSCEQYADAEVQNATIKIIPASGYHVSKVSFDNVNWIKITYCKAELGNTNFATNVTYFANEQSNAFALNFEVISHDFEADGSIPVYVQTASGAYSGLRSSGSVNGVALQATTGGAAYILGADLDNLADAGTITCEAVAMDGYKFVKWTDVDGNSLGTTAVAHFQKSQVMDSVVIAVFEPV